MSKNITIAVSWVQSHVISWIGIKVLKEPADSICKVEELHRYQISA